MSAPECTDVFPNPRPLGVLRGEIDKIDSQLVELLNARARLAQEVGARKRMFPTDSDTIYSPSREQMLLSRIHNSNKGPLRRNTIESIWREIMSGSISLEKGLTIGYLGPEYSFTHLAATKHFGNSLNYSPVKTIKSLFEEVMHFNHCVYSCSESQLVYVLFIDSVISLRLHFCRWNVVLLIMAWFQ